MSPRFLMTTPPPSSLPLFFVHPRPLTTFKLCLDLLQADHVSVEQKAVIMEAEVPSLEYLLEWQGVFREVRKRGVGWVIYLPIQFKGQNSQNFQAESYDPHYFI